MWPQLSVEASVTMEPMQTLVSVIFHLCKSLRLVKTQNQQFLCLPTRPEIIHIYLYCQ